MKELHFLRDDFLRRYGHPLHRIPVDLGLSCPHRSKNGTGGCVFCSANGSRAAHLLPGLPLKDQVRIGIDYAVRRYHAEPPYIAYFQAFTSTNADTDTLRKLYQEVLDNGDFAVIIVSTRPDCLSDDCLDFFSDLAQKYEFWVELGVQTANDITLDRINRGHHFDAVQDAAKRLSARGLHCAAHVILGLPGETMNDYLETARSLRELPFSAVKVHNLLVLKDTELVKMYHRGEVTPLNEYDYAQVLCAFLKELPEHWFLMRLSAEAKEDEIIAPRWWMKKGQFLEMFSKWFESGKPELPDTSGVSKFLPVRTEDGSYTLYHPAYRQHFHSLAGAAEESLQKYIIPCGVERSLCVKAEVRILEIGFGLGENSFAAWNLANQVKQGFLEFTSLELDPGVLPAALMLPENPAKPFLKELQETNGRAESEHASVRIIWGDARETVKTLREPYDFIFLDAFCPDSNPELWTVDFLKCLAALLRDDGLLATYSSAYPFLGGLLEAGLLFFGSPPFGRKRPGILAAKHDRADLIHLPEKMYGIAQKSCGGIPYRDPDLSSTRKEIFSRRKEEYDRRRKEGLPKWYTGKAREHSENKNVPDDRNGSDGSSVAQ